MSSTLLRVDSTRLLAHLPHFFTSVDAAIAEVLQNAHRSGATRVDMTIAQTEDGRVAVMFLDNGPGVTDPDVLFTAAKTGWNEEVVIEPAGLGFLSFLGIADTVTIESVSADGAWTATLPHAVFEGAAFDLLPREVNRSTGLALHAVLQDHTPTASLFLTAEDVTNGTLPRWRHAFPITVVYHRFDADGTEQIFEIPTHAHRWHETPVLHTPYGDLFAQPGRWSQRDDVVVWEHRMMTYRLDELIAILKARHGAVGQVVAASLPTTLVWVLPADSPLRPQLPERTALIEDAAFHTTLEGLADALVAAFDYDHVQQVLTEVGTSLPNVCEQHRATVATPLTPHDTKSAIAPLTVALPLPSFWLVPERHMLQLAGYHLFTVYDPYDETGDWSNDGEGYDGERHYLWMKNVPTLRDPVLAEILAMQNIWVRPDPEHGQDARVVLDNYRALDTTFDGWLTIGRARALWVVDTDGRRLGPLTWLAQPARTALPGLEATPYARLIVADTAFGDLGLTETASYPIPFLLRENDSQTFWDYVDDETVDFSTLIHQIVLRAQAVWDPDTYHRAAASDQAMARAEAIRAVRYALDAVRPHVADALDWQAWLAIFDSLTP